MVEPWAERCLNLRYLSRASEPAIGSVQRYGAVLTQHVFDKLRSIDMTLAEFQQVLGSGEVIEERSLPDGPLHELVLVLTWTRPLHVVVMVDSQRGEERIVTVYEPEASRWTADFRRRKF